MECRWLLRLTVNLIQCNYHRKSHAMQLSLCAILRFTYDLEKRGIIVGDYS